MTTVAQALFGSTPVAYAPQASFVVLSAASRAATTSSVVFQNYFARGLLLVLDATVGAGAPTLTLQVEAQLADGEYLVLFAAAAAVAATSVAAYLLLPGAELSGDVTEVAAVPVPTNFRITVTHGTADAVTYSVMGELVA